jgi:two-component system, OmpR family, sensor histidine kinase KdpD
MRLSARQWLVWFGALAAVTAGMLAVRDSLDKAHVALAYLLLVLGASSRGGRVLGFTLAVAAFLSFNFFFLPPYHTLVVAEPVDWLVLAAFLATGAVAAQLLDRAQSEASAAQRRTAEVDRLSALGAETLNAGRAEQALTAIADVIRTTLGVAGCDIYLRDEARGTVMLAAASGSWSAALTRPAGAVRQDEDTRLLGLPGGARLVDWVADSGRAAVERVDGTVRVAPARGGAEPVSAEALGLDPSGARTLLLPLRVRDRTVGVLRVAHADALTLDAPQRRFLEALSYYAALGVERVRLVAVAEHADALRQADELKNALLASVSHDLRTPLTTIKALAHAIAAGGDDRAVTIEEESDRLNRFVADLLDLSRIAGGALVVAPEVNAVEDLLGAALQRVSGALNGRTLDVSLGADEPMLVGRFDFVHSLRILVNLIENALKYSPAGSRIELRARRDGEALELTVADRGPGVPLPERQRIFEPFYRPAGGPPDAGGAGLGLSIARRLAEAQGGTVRYEPRDGGGSLFVVRLPVADLAEPEAEAARSL